MHVHHAGVIYMSYADAIAGGTPAKLGKAFINHVPHTLILENIISELIPHQAWHLRKTTNMTTPVLDLPWTYQHQYQLHKYLVDRDEKAAAPSTFWQSTAIEFMNAVHPLPCGFRASYWHAARRSTRIFDWVGHGRNQAKCISSALRADRIGPADTIPCPHCGLPDDQAHIMLTCTHPPLTPIRQRAKRLQSYAASQLRIKHHSAFDKYLIEQLTFASWIPHSTNTRRLWLGMWTTQLLMALLPPSTTSTSHMQTSDRYKYRKIIHKLTFPLTYAYRQMLKIHRPNHLTQVHSQQHTTARLRHRTSLLIPQQPTSGTLPSLHLQRNYINPDAFTFSDAANNLNEHSIGIHRTST